MPGWSDFLFFLFFCVGAVNVLLFSPRFEFRFSEDGRRLRWKMLRRDLSRAGTTMDKSYVCVDLDCTTNR